MRQDEKPKFGDYITDVMAYYRKDASRFVLDVWWAACQGFEMEQVRKAIQAHIMDPDKGQFAPKVADMVRVLQGTMSDRAAVAWGVVMQHMQGTGAYQDIDFGDPAIHATVHDLGGWPKLCRTNLDELGHAQRRFCEGYRAYSTRGVVTCPLVLGGDRAPDSEYEKRGLPAPAPVMVTGRSCADAMKEPTLLQRTVMQALPGMA